MYVCIMYIFGVSQSHTYTLEATCRVDSRVDFGEGYTGIHMCIQILYIYDKYVSMHIYIYIYTHMCV